MSLKKVQLEIVKQSEIDITHAQEVCGMFF